MQSVSVRIQSLKHDESLLHPKMQSSIAFSQRSMQMTLKSGTLKYKMNVVTAKCLLKLTDSRDMHRVEDI